MKLDMKFVEGVTTDRDKQETAVKLSDRRRPAGLAAKWPRAPEPGTELSLDGFNQNGERVVDLTGAPAALTGNPEAPAARRFRLDLTSRTAGRLDLAAPVERRSLRHIWRALAAGDAAPQLAFAEEGAQALPLSAAGMPGDAALSEIRVTVKGVTPPERVQPPVGPEPSDLVEIVLDANRAALVRLPTDTRLASLAGVRLPLAAAPGGAQATVALWSSTAAGEPDAPIPAGVSKPVPLDAGSGSLDLVRVRPALS